MMFMLFLCVRVDENVITKESRYSRKTLFMRSINVAGALVRPNDITKNS